MGHFWAHYRDFSFVGVEENINIMFCDAVSNLKNTVPVFNSGPPSASVCADTAVFTCTFSLRSLEI